MPKLCVNVDHVATVREARRTDEPDPVAAALIAERSGAVGITIHLREDRRHIQDRDLRIMREVVRGKLNLEMAPVEEMLAIALEVRPDQATLVPERREEVTTEGGLDAAAAGDRLARIATPLQEAGIRASLFIDPHPVQIETSKRIDADYVELNTAAYAEAKKAEDAFRELETLRAGAERAHALGLRVHAGHGLTYLNVSPVARLPHLEELNIGHSIVSHAVFVGFEKAVREMATLVERRGKD